MDASANALFVQAMDKPGRDSPATSCSFPIPALDGGDLVVGHLIPTPGQARDIFDGAAAIFVVTPLSAPKAPDVSLIQALFDLTPAEARVARGVVEGATVANLAQRFGVSRETIRSQIKSVFSKTGAQRQADLVSQLGGVGAHRVCQK
jgi:DNA-binding CsgD family transcriptional regulator